MSHTGDIPFDVFRGKSGFEEAFARAWRGEVEMTTSIGWLCGKSRAGAKSRFCALQQKYLRQTGFNFSRAYVDRRWSANAGDREETDRTFLLCVSIPRIPPKADVNIQALTVEMREGWIWSPTWTKPYLAAFLAVSRRRFAPTTFPERTRWRREQALSVVKFNPAQVPGLPEPKAMFEFTFTRRRPSSGVH